MATDADLSHPEPAFQPRSVPGLFFSPCPTQRDLMATGDTSACAGIASRLNHFALLVFGFGRALVRGRKRDPVLDCHQRSRPCEPINRFPQKTRGVLPPPADPRAAIPELDRGLPQTRIERQPTLQADEQACAVFRQHISHANARRPFATQPVRHLHTQPAL